MRNWKDIDENLNNTLNIIFEKYDINSLNYYEKRRIIFEYLIKTIKYDYDLLEKIRDFNVYGIRVKRDNFKELDNVIYNKIGICNGISQYYKLLLEKVGIISYCVICDDGTEVKHQLNLVYDSYNDSYSFDDVTSVIVNRGTSEEYFDYNLDYANSINQGNKVVMNNKNYFILPEEFINFLVGREKSLSETLEDLPSNIISIKNKYKSIK